jgi:hypothetical protein
MGVIGVIGRTSIALILFEFWGEDFLSHKTLDDVSVLGAEEESLYFGTEFDAFSVLILVDFHDVSELGGPDFSFQDKGNWSFASLANFVLDLSTFLLLMTFEFVSNAGAVQMVSGVFGFVRVSSGVSGWHYVRYGGGGGKYMNIDERTLNENLFSGWPYHSVSKKFFDGRFSSIDYSKEKIFFLSKNSRQRGEKKKECTAIVHNGPRKKNLE